MRYTKTVKQMLAAVLALVMIVTTVSLNAAADETNIEASGTVTDDNGTEVSGLSWAVTTETDSDGSEIQVLTISGSGALPDYSSTASVYNSPWKAYKSTLNKVVIEEGVTAVGTCSFKGFSALTEVSLPSTLETIGAYAFYQTTALTSIVIPANVSSIGGLCFYNCKSLTSVTIESGKLVYLEGSTFACNDANAHALTITIPVSLQYFAEDTIKEDWAVFRKISSLVINYEGTQEQWSTLIANSTGNSAELPEDTTINYNYGVEDNDPTEESTEESAEESTEESTEESVEEGLYLWDEATKTLTITANAADEIAVDYEAADLTSRPWITVDGVDVKSNAETIVIKEGITTLGKHAFRGFTALKNVVFEGDTLTTINEGVFRQCKALTEITIPASVSSFGRVVFYDCTSLTTVVLNGSFTTIGDQNFGNTAITTLTINAPVTSLPSANYGQFRNLTDDQLAAMTIYYNSGTCAQWAELLATDGALGLDKVGTVICSDGKYEPAVDAENVWISGDITFTLVDGVMTLSGEGATGNYGSKNSPWYGEEITEVIVGKGVTVLGNGLFYGETTLQKVTFEEESQLTQIGNATFRECDLTAITIPTTVTKIGRAAFYSNQQLEQVVIGDTEGNGSLEYLVALVFADCVSLETIYLPESLIAIELEDTTLGNSANGSDNINTKSTFYNCTSLTDIYFGGTVAEWEYFLSISDSASALLKATITVHCLGDGQTYRYGVMTGNGYSSTLIDGVLTITPSEAGDGVISGDAPWADDAENVSVVVLQPGVTAIEANVFAGCDNITKVYFLGSDEEWDALAAASDAEGNEAFFSAQFCSGTHGSCGDNVTWTLDLSTGVMTFSGTGDMYNYSSSTTPWRYSRDYIKKAVVEEGVTSIGDCVLTRWLQLEEVELAGSIRILGTNCFQGCLALTEIVLPEGLEIIGSKAFNGATGLETITLPESLTVIDMKAFDNAISLKDVIYNGTKAQRSLIVISEQAQGNAWLLNAQWTYAQEPDAGTSYDDVDEGIWYEEAINYLLDYQHLSVDGSEVGVNEALERDVVLDILWRRDGAPAMYESEDNPNTALNWAEYIGLIDGGSDETLTLAELVTILYRTAQYNSNVTSQMVSVSSLSDAEGLSDEQAAALEWAERQGYLTELKNNVENIDAAEVMTRGAGYSVLAAYLQSDASSADRYNALTAMVKEALAAGGDGNMYILTPKMFVSENEPSTKCGDCTVIVFPEGTTMMIDGGSSHCSAQIIQLLSDIGLKNLDYFVLSHPHADHIGGGTAVAKYIDSIGGTISCYYRPPFNKLTAENTFRTYLVETFGTEVHSLFIDENGNLLDAGNVQNGDGTGTAYTMPVIDGVTVQVFNPTQAALDVLETDTSDGAVNNVSLLMKFTYGDSTYLTGGDLYTARELELIAENGDDFSADVMKTNHHGTYTSNSAAWMEAVNALVAISDADDNGAEFLREQYTQYGTAWYTCGYDGLIVVTMDGTRNYDIQTQYDSYMRKDYTGEIGKITNITVQSGLKIEAPYTCTLDTEDCVLKVSGGADADTLSLIYTSSDPSVLTIDEDGTIVPAGTGTATITVTKTGIGYNTIVASAVFTVTAASESSSGADETTAADGTGGADETTAADGTGGADESTAADGSGSTNETTAADGSGGADETTAADQTSGTDSTTAVDDTTGEGGAGSAAGTNGSSAADGSVYGSSTNISVSAETGDHAQNGLWIILLIMSMTVAAVLFEKKRLLSE